MMLVCMKQSYASSLKGNNHWEKKVLTTGNKAVMPLAVFIT